MKEQIKKLYSAAIERAKFWDIPADSVEIDIDGMFTAIFRDYHGDTDSISFTVDDLLMPYPEWLAINVEKKEAIKAENERRNKEQRLSSLKEQIIGAEAQLEILKKRLNNETM